MPTTRKAKTMPGKFLQGQGQGRGQGQLPTARQPFTQHEGVDRAVQSARGMTSASWQRFFILTSRVFRTM